MGLHTLGRARRHNSGYHGQWAGAYLTSTTPPLQLDNNYYRGLLHRGWERAQWSPDQQALSSSASTDAVRVRTTTHQWVWDHEGSDHLMLNTDMCLAYALGASDLINQGDCCCNCAAAAAALPATVSACPTTATDATDATDAESDEHEAHLNVTRAAAAVFAADERAWLTALAVAWPLLTERTASSSTELLHPLTPPPPTPTPAHLPLFHDAQRQSTGLPQLAMAVLRPPPFDVHSPPPSLTQPLLVQALPLVDGAMGPQHCAHACAMTPPCAAFVVVALAVRATRVVCVLTIPPSPDPVRVL